MGSLSQIDGLGKTGSLWAQIGGLGKTGSVWVPISFELPDQASVP